MDVVRKRPDQFQVYALVAGNNVELLAEQVREFRPEVVVVATEAAALRLRPLLADTKPEIAFGSAAYVQAAIAAEADFVLSAIVGVAGLEATYEAVVRGKRVGLANKETLVAAGRLVMDAARRAGTEIIPVDSEHNGAHQCLRAGLRSEVAKLILTASGGPFRNTPQEKMAAVTPEQALNHPTWKMGPRITIDSSTLMNKGFEVIEACWLFDFPPSQVDVVVHPQSSIHAMVEFHDGSVIAQVSATDMRMPIQYAMTYPARMDAPVPRLDWRESRTWTFEAPDFHKFPLLRMAYEAQEAGGAATCVLNAADEVAVEAFLNRQIPFGAIPVVVAETLSRMPARTPASVGEVLEIDREARAVARERIGSNLAQTTTALGA